MNRSKKDILDKQYFNLLIEENAEKLSKIKKVEIAIIKSKDMDTAISTLELWLERSGYEYCKPIISDDEYIEYFEAYQNTKNKDILYFIKNIGAIIMTFGGIIGPILATGFSKKILEIHKFNLISIGSILTGLILFLLWCFQIRKSRAVRSCIENTKTLDNKIEDYSKKQTNLLKVILFVKKNSSYIINKSMSSRKNKNRIPVFEGALIEEIGFLSRQSLKIYKKIIFLVPKEIKIENFPRVSAVIEIKTTLSKGNSFELLRKIGIDEDNSLILSSCVESLEHFDYVSQKYENIKFKNPNPKNISPEQLYNPTEEWRNRYSMATLPEKLLLRIEILITLIGSCDIEYLNDFCDIKKQSEYKNNEWVQKITSEKCFIVVKDNKIRSRSFASIYYLKYYESCEYKYEIEYEKFKRYCLDREWEKTKNLRYADIIPLIEYFTPTGYCEGLTKTVLVRNAEILLHSKCIRKIALYLYDNSFGLDRIKNIFFSGYYNSTLSVVLTIEEVLKREDIKLSWSWYAFISEMFQSVAIDNSPEALEYSKLSLDTLGSMKVININDYEKKQRLNALSSLYSIATNRVALEHNQALASGIVNSILEQLRPLLPEKFSLDPSSINIICEYCKVAARSKIFVPSDKKHWLSILGEIFDNKHLSWKKVLKNEILNLEQTTIIIEALIRYVDVCLPKENIDDRIYHLETLEKIISPLYREKPKSAKLLELLFLTKRGLAYIYLSQGKNDSFVCYTNSIDYLLSEYEKNITFFSEDVYTEREIIYVFLDKLTDAIQISTNYKNNYLDEKLLPLSKKIASMSRYHLENSEIYSDTEFCKWSENYSIVNAYVEKNTGLLAENQKKSTLIFNSIESIKSKIDINKNEIQRIARDTINSNIKSVNSRRLIKTSFSLFKLNLELLAAGVSNERETSKYFCYAISFGRFNNRKFLERFIKINDPTNEKRSSKIALEKSYQSSRLYPSYELVSNYFAVVKIVKISEFGLLVENQVQQLIYIPRICINFDYCSCKHDFTNSRISKIINRKKDDLVVTNNRYFILIQSLGEISSNANEIDKYRENIRLNAPDKIPDFQNFIQRAKYLGTMRGPNFVSNVLNRFLIPETKVKLLFEKEKNIWLTNSRGTVILRVPERYIAYYKNKIIREWVFSLCGVVSIYVFSDNQTPKEVLDEVCDSLRIKYVELNDEESVLNIYDKKNINRNYKKITVIMEKLFGIKTNFIDPISAEPISHITDFTEKKYINRKICDTVTGSE